LHLKVQRIVKDLRCEFRHSGATGGERMSRFSFSSKKTAERLRRGQAGAGADGTDSRSTPSTAARTRLLHWTAALLCMTIAATATFLVFENFVLSKVPRAMLGKWVVTEGEMEGATLEFFRNGTMLAKVDVNGNERFINAKVRADENTVWSTTTNPMTGQEDTAAQTIISLTATEFVLEDKKGTLMKMERAR
jgi:hypothetical protein